MPSRPVVIACAMEEEAEPFLEALVPDGEQAVNLPNAFRGPTKFSSGSLFGQSAVVVTTGIGMTNAALAATVACMELDPKAYILAGTTGGLGADVNLGHGIISGSALYHDADASAFGYEPGQIPQMPKMYEPDATLLGLAQQIDLGEKTPIHTGQVSASNSFVTAPQVRPVRAKFPSVVAVDMETAAAAQVCFAFDVPWISLRAVSDMCDPDAANVFAEGAPNAAEVSFRMVRALANRISQNK